MTERTDQRDAIAAALAVFAARPLADAARGLFAALGYASDRRVPLATPKAFIGQFDAAGRLTERECETLQRLASLHLLFQLTDAELTSTGDLFDDPAAVQTTQIHSYLFFAAELPAGHYTRTDLSAVARALNKPLPMPALLLLKHGDTVSLAIIHRRLNKRDAERDVLEKATLIKDIRFEEPIRAHLEILNDFALANLDADFGVSNFVTLHTAWQRRLGSYALSNDFYREIADWYFWAHHLVDSGTIRLPQHCDTEQEKSLFLIRLLTRVIFCWFLVEKRLIPADLFRDRPLKKLIKDLSPDTSTYYHAVLQNLFFGTLNMPGDLRGFREKKKGGQRYDPNYGITNLWRYETDFLNPADWLKLAERIPFLNGGLFDCLDDKSGKRQDNFILDGFSDNPDLACRLPNDLFFGPERNVDLSKDYGEEDKRTARSKRAKVRGLIEILSRYKFTIEENTPLEEEIALDPELLGKVFENLLASYNEDTQTTARKALGAFYTPREIVTYMVDEALKSYLSTRVPRCKAALDNLFSNAATPKEIKSETRDELIKAIGEVKILDPACGSGAFPMGALHRLVDLLQKLDPNNELWKRDRLAEAERYCQVLEESGAPKEEIAACHARIEDIKKSFDTRFHALDFARKLYLIENGIYGVDIQPVAVQIAKLRFFISLVVDQKVDMKSANLGVRPLPNLETRLVAADTLIPIPKAKAQQANLFDDDVEAFRELQKLKEELKRIRHEHFNARDPSRKRHWRDEDQRVRETMRDLLRKTGMPSATAKAMSAWDPYDQNAAASFFDSEWMFGLPVGKFRVLRNAPSTLLGNLALVNNTGGQMEFAESDVQEIESGFDIVIGNPPYVRPHKIPFDYKERLWEHYSVFEKKADLYTCFIERGVALLKTSGRLAFIVSDGFLRLDSFEQLRLFLLKKTLVEQIIDFTEDVFKSAAVKTCVLVLAKSETEKDTHLVRTAELASVEGLQIGRFTSIPQIAFLGKFKAVFDLSTSVPTDAIKTQIEKNSIQLGKRFEVQFGLKTGDDSKFLTHKATSPDHKKLLRGENVGRYVSKFAGEFVWYVPDKMTAHRHTARPGSRERFEQPKVLIRDTGNGLMGTYDDDNYYVKDVLIVSLPSKDTHSLKATLGLLNSSTLRFYYETTFPTLHVQRNELASLPLSKQALSDGAKILGALVDIILFLNRCYTIPSADQSTRDPLMLAYFEQILNGLVYELYFPEEVHGAGMHLFDAVAKAKLPAIETIPEEDRLPRLRTLFETLYDGTHPLRIALDKLQTLDTVRIIEGKA